MSDSFFNQSLSPPQQTASLKSRKTRTAPPPPPPPPAAAARTINATNFAAPLYYGNVPPRSSAPQPPPPKQRQSHTTSTSHSSGATAAAAAAATPFYTTSTSTNNRTAGGYSASGASYYGTPAPAAYTNNGSATMTTSSSFANTNTKGANTNYEWNTNATNKTPTTSSDWYSAAPQPQQSQSQYNPSQPQPSYTDYTQSSFSTSTFDTNSSELMMEGSIGTNAQEFSTFLPQQPTATMQSSSNIMEDEDDEAPLLEELGVNLPHIFLKTKAVVLPFSKFGIQAQQVLHEDDNDLAGPLVFALLLGGELLLSGKLQFSYIYGFCSLGCLFLTLVLNLMSPALPVSIWTVASILGYALLPVNILAVCKILLVDLVKLEKVGRVFGILTICWCTVASTRLLEQKCGMRAQRYLLAYPIALLYSAFVMITIF